MVAKPVIKVRGLNFTFGHDPVLEDVDLTVGQGEFLALVGPNGGGKTTLLRLLLGLLRPVSGSIEVLGQSPAGRLGNIGYVPQHTTVQPGFPVSVLEAVLMGIPRRSRQRFGHARKDRDRAMAALDRVGLFGREGLRFGDLSGGQKQRTLIARALVGEAGLLLLDEPTANVDPQGSFCLYDFLCTLASDERITIACVSHDLSILGSRITSIACVNRKLAYSPTPQLSQKMLEMLYGTHDHTCAMDEFMKSVSSQFGPEQHAQQVRVPLAAGGDND